MSSNHEASCDPATNQSFIFDEDRLNCTPKVGDSGRLPITEAYPLIILLSLSSWAVILTIVLSLVGIAH